jgi:AI-2 transport protein TqsA
MMEWGPRPALMIIATIAVLAAVKLARSVIAPVALALFIIALAWPLQSRLQSRLPRLVALAIVMFVTASVFVAFASIITWGFGRVGRSLVSDSARFQVLYAQVTQWLEGHGIAVAGGLAEHFNVAWLVRNLQSITGRVNSTATFWLVVFVYVMLGLLEVHDADRKVGAMNNQEAARVLREGSVATVARFRRYVLVRTLMSVTTGVLVWAFAAFVGWSLQSNGA